MQDFVNAGKALRGEDAGGDFCGTVFQDKGGDMPSLRLDPKGCIDNRSEPKLPDGTFALTAAARIAERDLPYTARRPEATPWATAVKIRLGCGSRQRYKNFDHTGGIL